VVDYVLHPLRVADGVHSSCFLVDHPISPSFALCDRLHLASSSSLNKKGNIIPSEHDIPDHHFIQYGAHDAERPTHYGISRALAFVLFIVVLLALATIFLVGFAIGINS
jgi:hypothetical protein